MLAEEREEKKHREKAPVPAGVSRKRTKKKMQENKSCTPAVTAEVLQTRRLYTRDQVPWVQQLCSPGDNGQLRLAALEESILHSPVWLPE